MLNRFEQFSFLISGINRYIQKIERDEMEKNGYKGAFAQYLVILNRFPEGITLTTLCELSDKDKAAVSRAVTQMEQVGLVERIYGDGVYKYHIALTEKGKETTAFVFERAKEAVNAVGDEMTEEERRFFYGMLELISSRLEEFSKRGTQK